MFSLTVLTIFYLYSKIGTEVIINKYRGASLEKHKEE